MQSKVDAVTHGTAVSGQGVVLSGKRSPSHKPLCTRRNAAIGLCLLFAIAGIATPLVAWWASSTGGSLVFSSATPCSGGKIWNECGSPCETTCVNHLDVLMCVEVCDSRCECPSSSPIWDEAS